MRLGDVATVYPRSSLESVNHYTVQRDIDIAANVEGRDLGATAADIQAAIKEISKGLPITTHIDIRGQSEVMQASFRSLAAGLILAVILVYALLVVLFQSWVDPFIIMMAVPGALMGILWILALTGTTINVESLMGSIMAVGISVSNSILVVSFANDLRARTLDPRPRRDDGYRGGDRRLHDPATPRPDDRAGHDHRHDPDGAWSRRRRRAERAARARGDRRADRRHDSPPCSSCRSSIPCCGVRRRPCTPSMPASLRRQTIPE